MQDFEWPLCSPAAAALNRFIFDVYNVTHSSTEPRLYIIQFETIVHLNSQLLRADILYGEHPFIIFTSLLVSLEFTEVESIGFLSLPLVLSDVTAATDVD